MEGFPRTVVVVVLALFFFLLTFASSSLDASRVDCMVSCGAEDFLGFDMGTLLTACFFLAIGLVPAKEPYSFLKTFFLLEVSSSATKSSSSLPKVFFFLALVE